MRRRTFIQTLLAAPLAAIGRPFAVARQAQPPPTYSDSQGRTEAELTALRDGARASGGVTYQP